MYKKLFLPLVLFSLFFLQPALTAHAGLTGEYIAPWLEKISQRKTYLISLRDNQLKKKNVRDQEKTKITAIVKDLLVVLNNGAKEIKEAQTVASLNSAYRNNVYNTRIYSVMGPKIKATALYSQLYSTIDTLNGVITDQTSAIDGISNSDKKGQAQALLNQAISSLSDATTNVDDATAIIDQLKPAKDAKPVVAEIKTAKSQLKTAAQLTKECLTTVNQIQAILKDSITAQDQCSGPPKQCSDGSYVYSTGPKCEYAPCPGGDVPVPTTQCAGPPKRCSDGSYVYSTGPNCEYPACGGNNRQMKLLWKSSPKGDLIADKRSPQEVCSSIQKNQKLEKCTIIQAKTSNSKNECVDGKSVAGCYACLFSCSE